MSVKVGFVIPWYGENIPGGAESHCQSIVKAMLQCGICAEVLTTCVEKFNSDWNHNFHPEGTATEGGVTVRRFRVRERDTTRFDAVNYKLMHHLPVSTEDEQVYMAEMITSPALCDFIAKSRDEYVYLFMPYMFGTTYWGSRVCPERSILIPCLHDESYARMSVVRETFERVCGLLFNSDKERELAEHLYSLDRRKLAAVGEPVNCEWTSDPRRFRTKYGCADFFLYAGRTEQGKGADVLVQYFCRYLDETGRSEQLVFIGGGDLEIPEAYRSRIFKLGFLPAQDKYDAYAAATALCVPSVMESFSIVMMESWLAGRPVIANAQCAVTTDFCCRSNGGLYFSDYDEFREILLLLASEPKLCAAMGANGREYVLHNFHPETVAARYRQALEGWGFMLQEQPAFSRVPAAGR